MATLDVLALAGGQAANFLDVGGGATAEAVKKSFEIILAQTGVKAIFVNVSSLSLLIRVLLLLLISTFHTILDLWRNVCRFLSSSLFRLYSQHLLTNFFLKFIV